MHIIKIDATASTNSFLKEMLQASAVQGEVLVVAKKQTQGRGQMGTSWQSVEGKSLTFSVYKSLDGLNTAEQFYISMAVAIALTDVLRSFKIKAASIKWPNDILADGKKVAGVLIENVLRGNKIKGSIVGIGLNVNEDSFEGLPQACSMKMATGEDYDTDTILEEVIKSLDLQFSDLREKEYSKISEKYHSLLFGKNVISVFQEPSGTRFNGIILGVAENGKIKISVERGQIKLFDLKEVKMLY